jgi:hypothetical protein
VDVRDAGREAGAVPGGADRIRRQPRPRRHAIPRRAGFGLVRELLDHSGPAIKQTTESTESRVMLRLSVSTAQAYRG